LLTKEGALKSKQPTLQSLDIDHKLSGLQSIQATLKMDDLPQLRLQGLPAWRVHLRTQTQGAGQSIGRIQGF
jgi:hypothetical protein